MTAVWIILCITAICIAGIIGTAFGLLNNRVEQVDSDAQRRYDALDHLTARLGRRIDALREELRADAKTPPVPVHVPRCPSCDHLIIDHAPGGCWRRTFTTKSGQPDICTCTLAHGQAPTEEPA